MKDKRASFKARHAKNIAKGKMSAAYWADKVMVINDGNLYTGNTGRVQVLTLTSAYGTWRKVSTLITRFTSALSSGGKALINSR